MRFTEEQIKSQLAALDQETIDAGFAADPDIEALSNLFLDKFYHQLLMMATLLPANRILALGVQLGIRLSEARQMEQMVKDSE